MEEVLSSASSVRADAVGSSDDPEDDEGESETKVTRKKKNKRKKGAVSLISLS